MKKRKTDHCVGWTDNLKSQPVVTLTPPQYMFVVATVRQESKNKL